MQRENSLILFAALTLTACSPASNESESKKAGISVVRADKVALEAKAVAACECEVARGKGQSPDCWTNYRKATAAFRPKDEEGLGGMATACAPISTSIDCLKDADGEFCIVTGYEASGVNLREPRLCRQDEAEAIEHAFNAEFAKPDGNQANADRAAKEALAAVRAGKAPKAPSASSGCA
jgi:hypothetical protein